MKTLALEIIDWGETTKKTITSPEEVWGIGGPTASVILPDSRQFSRSDSDMNDITYLLYDAVVDLME